MLRVRSSFDTSALLAPPARLVAMVRPRLVTASVSVCACLRSREALTSSTASTTRPVMSRLSLTLRGSRNFTGAVLTENQRIVRPGRWSIFYDGPEPLSLRDLRAHRLNPNQSFLDPPRRDASAADRRTKSLHDDGGGRNSAGQAIVGDEDHVDAGPDGAARGIGETVVLLDRAHSQVVADDDAAPAEIAAQKAGDRALGQRGRVASIQPAIEDVRGHHAVHHAFREQHPIGSELDVGVGGVGDVDEAM